MLDYLITGGRVIDPYNHIDQIMPIGIQDGRITQADGNTEAAQVIDASGCIVTPGLIDAHTHLWPMTNMGVQAEAANFPSCVTTAIDGGSCGSGTYECIRPAIQGMHLGVKVLLHVCSAGLTAFHTKVEYLDPSLFERKNILRLVRQYPDEIVGLKIRMGKETALDMGLAPLKAAQKIAQEAGLPLVVHCTNPPVPMKELIDCLAPGDVLTHAYHGHGHTLMEEGGFEALASARERGVYIDVGDAGWHISFDVMREALRLGLTPDSISTDMTDRGLYKKGGTFNLLQCAAKWLNLGMTVNQIVECLTIGPARQFHMEGAVGHLAEGLSADVAILRETDVNTLFRDGVGQEMMGVKLLRPMATFKSGRIVYRDIAF